MISPAAINSTVTPAPIPRLPWITYSQHFFIIATRIDVCVMQISGDTEFYLFMDMRVEFTWISFKIIPKQWIIAIKIYNNHLEEKSHGNSVKVVGKNPRPFFESLVRLKLL
ncbi:hypothetical protein C8R48DRAFT_589772 [Suillus tomentosus]|nr:hypothetical protein C8R48DRAFT_589772 [Suillus tomentosus]